MTRAFALKPLRDLAPPCAPGWRATVRPSAAPALAPWSDAQLATFIEQFWDIFWDMLGYFGQFWDIWG